MASTRLQLVNCSLKTLSLYTHTYAKVNINFNLNAVSLRLIENDPSIEPLLCTVSRQNRWLVDTYTAAGSAN